MSKHNWPSVAASCRQLVYSNAMRFAELLGTNTLAPLAPEFIGQLLSLPVRTSSPEALQVKLFHDYNIEIPVMRHRDSVVIRYSINAFNSQDDLDRLFDALKAIIGKTALLER